MDLPNIPEIPTVPPSVADALTEGIYTGLEALQTASPFIAALGAGAIALVYHRDKKHNGGMAHRLAMGTLEAGYEPTENNASALQKIRRTAHNILRLTTNKSVLKSLMLPVAVGTFALAGEKDVREGQVDTLNTILGEVNEAHGLPADNHDYVLVTEGGIDTPMDTGRVPLSIAEELGGESFYLWLPKIQSEEGESMDGILMGIPGLPEGTVKVTGLTDGEAGENVTINGSQFEIDEMLPNDVSTMRREVAIVSSDVADEVIYGGNGDESWGILLPKDETKTASDLQAELDAKYGEGKYTAMTYQEFLDGTEAFMGGNGTALLTLVMAGFAISGATSLIEMVRMEANRKKREAALMRAMGAQTDIAVTPEVLKTSYRLAAALPAAGLSSVVFTEVVNSINPGLDATAAAKTLLGAFVVIAVPSVIRGRTAAIKIAEQGEIIDNMRQGAE